MWQVLGKFIKMQYLYLSLPKTKQSVTYIYVGLPNFLIMQDVWGVHSMHPVN